jgi:hypothetical protein
MPRKSVEAMAAAAWRQDRVLPEPTKYLPDKPKSLWLDVVSSKAPDMFDAGSYPLLAAFCTAAWIAEGLAERIAVLPVNDREAPRLERRWHKAVASMISLGTKCRLTVQGSVDRRSGMLTERWSRDNSLLRGRDS